MQILFKKYNFFLIHNKITTTSGSLKSPSYYHKDNCELSTRHIQRPFMNNVNTDLNGDFLQQTDSIY